MIANLLLAAVLAVAVPDGNRLVESTQCFTMYRRTPQGEVVFGHTLQTIEFAEHEGAPALRIVVHQYGANGAFDMRDEFLLAREDLRPIAFQSHFQGATGRSRDVELLYATDRITGSKTANGKNQRIDVPVSEPVWEGNLWGLTFAAMPLEAGAHFSLPFYQYDKGLGRFEIDVVETKSVATGQGNVEAWVVDAAIEGGPHSRYFIGKDPAAELGYEAKGFRQSAGGDCSAIPETASSDGWFEPPRHEGE